MILEIDVGNTFLKWRVRREQQVLGYGRFKTHDDFSLLATEWALWDFDKILVGSVASAQINQQLSAQLAAITTITPQFAVSRAEQLGLINSYPEPKRMGVDRWLAMLAGWQRSQRACCVVDCGTAITIDFVNDDGLHEGGLILPGSRLLQTTLIKNTDQIIFDEQHSQFEVALGRDTAAAVHHGADFIFDAIQMRLAHELSLRTVKEQPALYITGGDGELFHRLIQQGCWEPDLVLDGLQLAF